MLNLGSITEACLWGIVLALPSGMASGESSKELPTLKMRPHDSGYYIPECRVLNRKSHGSGGKMHKMICSALLSLGRKSHGF